MAKWWQFWKRDAPEMRVYFGDARAAGPDINIYSPNLALASQFGITDSDAPTAQEQRTAYRGLVYRLVQMRADAIGTAMAQARVMRQVDDEEYEPVEESHPWRTLLRQPSPHLDRFAFWETASQLRDMGRGAFLYVARGARGVPDCMYTIYPEFGEVYPQGDTTGGIAGFRYYASGAEGYTDIPPEDLVWVRHRHPVSFYESASLIEAAAYHSDLDLYLQIYGRDALREGNNPPFYASFKENLNQPQIDQYQKSFALKHTTLGRPKSIPVLGNGGELRPIGIRPEDMMYVETAIQNERQLMMIFGFKPAMFADGGVVSNSVELRRSWYQDSIQPEVDKLCADLTHQLHRVYGVVDDTLCIKPPNVIPKDPVQDARLYELEIRSGTRKPGDVIAMRGEDVPPELDQYFIAGGLRPVADMMREPEPAELDI
jgi:phage portal protein BeeE